MYMLAIYYYAMCCDIDSMVSLCIIVSFVIFFFLIIIIYHHHFFFFVFFSFPRYFRTLDIGQARSLLNSSTGLPSLPFPSFLLPSFSVYPCFSAIQHLQKSAIDPVGSIIVIIYNHNMIIVITFSVTTQPKIAHAYN